MTIIDVYLDVLIRARCDVCSRVRRVYPDPETDGRICLDCLAQCLEPLPEMPPDPEIMAMVKPILAEILCNTKGN